MPAQVGVNDEPDVLRLREVFDYIQRHQVMIVCRITDFHRGEGGNGSYVRSSLKKIIEHPEQVEVCFLSKESLLPGCRPRLSGTRFRLFDFGRNSSNSVTMELSSSVWVSGKDPSSVVVIFKP